MKRQILSVFLVLNVVTTHAFMPIKDIALTAVPSAAITYAGYLGYSTACEDQYQSWQGKVFLTSFFALFAAGFTVPFTIPFTSYYKFWKAKNTANKVLMHNLFLEYDLDQIETMDFDVLFEMLDTAWDAYPLASSFDLLSEWSSKIKEAIKLYKEVKIADERKVEMSDSSITYLRDVNNLLVLVRDIYYLS